MLLVAGDTPLYRRILQMLYGLLLKRELYAVDEFYIESIVPLAFNAAELFYSTGYLCLENCETLKR
jgi:hypothetical protein